MNHDNRGIVLLTSLMIMLLLAASGIALSAAIINSLRASRNSNQAAVAYYGAESGMERALFQATQARLANKKLSDAVKDIHNLTQQLKVPGLSFHLEANDQDSTDQVVTFLAQNETSTLDLFTVDNSIKDTSVRKVAIGWDSVNETEWIEVSWVGWKADGTFTSNNERRFYSQADLQHGRVIVDLSQPNKAVAMRLRVKALKAPINNLTIAALDSKNKQIPIPNSRLFLTSVGEYQTSKQALSTDVRWQLPLSPLFDYAIFSEKPIVK